MITTLANEIMCRPVDSDTFDIDEDIPGLDYVNLFLEHVDALIRDVYTNEFYFVHAPYTFFCFKEKIIVF